MFKQLSTEQLSILKSVQDGKNVIIDSCPGAGKTALVLAIAKELPHKKILQVTYNKSLKDEVREKSKNLENILIHTYHSLALYFFEVSGYDDHMINEILVHKKIPKRPITFDILCIDECQDMSKLYYQFMYYIISFYENPNTNKVSPSYTSLQMVILGDRYQSIYDFKGTDIRFLTFAHRIWGDRYFEIQGLTTSYRLTNQISAFINDCVINENRIHTIKDGPPVCYVRCDPFHVSHCHFLLTKLDIYEPEEIFILCPSLKGKHTKRLENILVKEGIQCFYPTSDDSKLDDDIIKGKIVFCTFHQSKGRERKCVVVYNFDMSYFTFYARDFNPEVCPNTLYVALTRASEQLIVIESFTSEPLPFLEKITASIPDFIDFHEIFYDGRCTKDATGEENIKHTIDVINLLKFVKDHYAFSLKPLVEKLFTIIKPARYKVQIPDKISNRDTDKHESVCEINGLVIPSIYESETRGLCTIISYVDDHISTTKNKYLKDYYKNTISEDNSSLENYLYYTMLYMSFSSGVINNLAQINDLSWLDDQMIDDCHKLLHEELQEGVKNNVNVRYEVPIIYECTSYQEYGSIVISGRMDAIRQVNKQKIVYEIKCVDSLVLDHYLQLIVYAWMCQKQQNYHSEYRLINIKTGEVCKLDHQNTFLMDDIMLILFKNKFGENYRLTNEEFLDGLGNHV